MTAMAFLSASGTDANPLTVDHIKSALHDAGVRYGLTETERLGIFAERALDGPVSFVAAAGDHPGMGHDARLEIPWLDETDFSDMCSLPAVSGGDVIARKIPATMGSDSVNVTGEILPGEWGFDISLNAGANVCVSDDGLVFTAAIDGCPRLVGNTISVDPIYTINGDVDESTGNIRFQGALDIRGSVLDGFIVECTGSAGISGSIMQARVESGGDMLVHQEIATGDHGALTAAGRVCAHQISNAAIQAGGNVTAYNAIMNSRVRCNGLVSCLSQSSRISGGEISACAGIKAAILGKDKDTKTKLNVGYRFDPDSEAIELNARMEKMNAERNKVNKALGANPGPAGEHKDKLLKLRDMIEGNQKKLDRMIAQNAAGRMLNTRASVHATQTMNPGCMVQIGNRIKLIRETLKNALFTVSDGMAVKLTYFDEKSNALRVQGISAGSQPRTALIVDDAKTMRMKLKKVLEGANITVVGEAGNGREGIEMFARLKPDIVTMDINMPDVDGVAALQAIMKIEPRARVVMVSALGQPDMVARTLQAGAADYITKPLVPDMAAQIILRALNKTTESI